MKPKEEVVAAPWASLASRIEAWRRTRLRRTGAMPEELWREAAALAARHGVYRISQELRLNFWNLKKRTESDGVLATTRSTAPKRDSFIEIVGIGEVGSREMASDTPRTEIEIAIDGGARLRLRHEGSGVDLPGVVAAFLRGAR
ncbi:MAG TPA: hypothetical protein PKI32_07330 [Opitutales bacterium]|nr:hypothetical protein [Opitutales bacterium]